jgi:hypothetical protein
LYKISILSKDKYGNWTGNGFLSFIPKGTCFWMIKYYINKMKLIQTIKLDYLLYDGMLDSDEFRGSWWFNGYKHRYCNRGEFIMRTILYMKILPKRTD